jgi:4-aminobutyrate--pyruvate transaminase
MNRISNSLAMRDVAYHLHSHTNARVHEENGPVTIIVRGEGVQVFDDQGKGYIEGMSGLWCAALGFGEKRLARAAAAQLERLPYYHTFYGRSNDVCIELAEMLIGLAPVPMSKVFFAASGSEANETMVKLAWFYNSARGKPEKRKVISRLRGFHGITIAAASMTGILPFHRDFNLPLPGFLHVACPYPYRGAGPGESEEAYAARLADELDQLIVAEGPETVAAFIAEPVMGAGGVIVPPKGYFPKIQAVLRKHDVLLLADEVICGFGRTGNWFGSQTVGLEPDLMSVAKALSSGYYPISAVLISDRIYQAVADNSAKLGNFAHGFTQSGNPVGAAVAREAIRIYQERDIVGRVRRVGPRLQDGLRALKSRTLVGDVRGVGLMAGVELVADRETKRPFDPAHKVPAYLERRALEHGLVVRALADTIACTPPLIIEEAEIDELLARLGRAFDDTEAWVAKNDLRRPA